MPEAERGLIFYAAKYTLVCSNAHTHTHSHTLTLTHTHTLSHTQNELKYTGIAKIAAKNEGDENRRWIQRIQADTKGRDNNVE